MKVAALDLGSNTFLMLIAEVSGGKISKVYRDELRVTRLGQGVHANRAFHEEALVRADKCFSEYQKIIQEEKPDKILAMATSAARDVSNSERLFDLGKKYQIPIEIIPGHREAEITFSGACSEREDKSACAVIDVGGGSTEVVFMNEKQKVTGNSLDVGSVRLTELFVNSHPVDRDSLNNISNYVKNEIRKFNWDEAAKNVKHLICVAGTPTTLASVIQEVDYSRDAVDGFVIPVSRMIEWRDRLAAMNLEDRKALKGMDPLRADVIVTGATILIETAKMFQTDSIIVSDRGVRYGVALLMEER